MRLSALAAFLCLALSPRSAAADSGDELAFFAEEAELLTASRGMEPARGAPAAVEVITAEEIRDSGAVTLWDLFRYRAGMTVVEGRTGEGNRAIVSIRGFPNLFVDNLQVLVDGRSVYTGLSGGAVWEALAIQIQDIERIEIVRGPSAALYGSNAALGVIHVITRRPAPARRFTAEALGGNRGLNREQFAYEDGGRRGAARLSLARKEQSGHPAAAPPGPADYLFSNKGNFRGLWTPVQGHAVELFAGGAWDNLGVVDPSLPAARFRRHYQMLKYGQEAGGGSSVEALLARKDDLRTYLSPSGLPLTVREAQYDAEFQHRLERPDERFGTVYGAGLRYTGIESGEIFSDHHYRKNAITRGFVRQSLRPLDALKLVGAFSLERSDTGGTEPAYNVAALWTPEPRHTLRLSHALAPTIPTLYQKSARQQTPGVLLAGNPELMPQRLSACELGWRGAFRERRLALETSLFYMESKNLSRSFVRSFAPFTLSFANSNSAIARGVEVAGSYRFARGRSAFANYTYESFSDGAGVTNIRKGTPPHALNLGGTARLAGGFSLSLAAGWRDRHTLTAPTTPRPDRDIPAYWRADARLAYAPRPGWELFVAAQNMLRARHLESGDGLEIPRTWQLGLRWEFAP